MTNILATQSAEARQGRSAHPDRRQASLRKLERADVGRRGGPIDPSPRSTRPSTAAILGSRSNARVARSQAGRRHGLTAPPADDVRPRPGRPAPLQQVRQGQPPPRGDPSTACAAVPSPRPGDLRMCNLYSITTNQAAISALFRVVNRYVGNLAPMPGVFPGLSGADRAQLLGAASSPPRGGACHRRQRR